MTVTGTHACRITAISANAVCNQSINWAFGRSIDPSIGPLVGWLVGWSNRSVGSSDKTDNLITYPTDTGGPTDGPTARLISWSQTALTDFAVMRHAGLLVTVMTIVEPGVGSELLISSPIFDCCFRQNWCRWRSMFISFHKCLTLKL